MKALTLKAIESLAKLTGRSIDSRSHVVNTTYTAEPYSFINTPEFRGRKKISRKLYIDCFRNNISVNINISYKAGYYILTAGYLTERILASEVRKWEAKYNQSMLELPGRLADQKEKTKNDLINIIKSCKYNEYCNASRFNMTGIDWKEFVRYSSVGGIYICAPDEPGNCIHIDSTDEYFSVYKNILDQKIKEI